MGVMDTEAVPFQYQVYFADLFNFLLYDGKPVIMTC